MKLFLVGVATGFLLPYAIRTLVWCWRATKDDSLTIGKERTEMWIKDRHL